MEELKKYLSQHLKHGSKYRLSEDSLLIFLDDRLLSWDFLQRINNEKPIEFIQIGNKMINIVFDIQTGLLPFSENISITIPEMSQAGKYKLAKEGLEIMELRA